MYYIDVRQCLLYDSAAKNARLIGVEYMVSKEIYETLDAEEQKLWHSHEVCHFIISPHLNLTPLFCPSAANTPTNSL
jgi:Protein of unknown function (DUF1264)